MRTSIGERMMLTDEEGHMTALSGERKTIES